MNKRIYFVIALLALSCIAVIPLLVRAPSSVVADEAVAAYHAYEQAASDLSASSSRVQYSERQARAASQTASRALAQADSQAQRSAAALADTAATADELRTQLAAQLEITDSLRFAVGLLTVAVDSLSASASSQQAAVAVVVASADSAIAAYRRLAESSAKPCRILRLIPCPTRGQAAIIGLAAGIAILR